MARYRIDILASLAGQMRFAPPAVRLAQMAAAEELLSSIEAAKAYPVDFVIFRITGYHPRDVAAELLSGAAVQHDLGLLIEQVSASMDLRTDACGQAVLAIEQVARKFNVTSKTIQRWRRRGLAARQFVFPDGKTRVGFLLSSVQRFASLHEDLVQRACAAACHAADNAGGVSAQRLYRLAHEKMHFIDDPLFHQDGAESAIETIVGQDEIVQVPGDVDSRIPRDLPPYLQELYRTALLSKSQERGLFLQLNYRKWQFVRARRRLDPQIAGPGDLELLEGLRQRITETRNRIAAANLRLVVSVARKHLRPGLDLMELISDGNLTLLRAIDSFDIARGTRFSTYVTLALMKGFARSVGLMLSARAANLRGNALASVRDSRPAADLSRLIERDQVGQMLSRLDSQQQVVLQNHYGLGGRPASASYAQLATVMGLSARRVRQIERGAIDQLRAASE